MDKEHVTPRSSGVGNEILSGLATVFVRGDGRGEDGSTCTSKFRGNKGDTLEVVVAILTSKAKVYRKFAPDGVSKEEGNATAAMLVENRLEGTSDGVLPGVVKTSEDDDEALLKPWRIAFAESLNDRPRLGLSY